MGLSGTAHAGEVMQFRRMFFLLLGAGELIFGAVVFGFVPGGILSLRGLAILLLGVPAGAWLLTNGWKLALHQAATTTVKTVLGAGNLEPAPSFSVMEAAVMRGQVNEAVRLFESHLALKPLDHDAHLALAEMRWTHQRDSAAVEALVRTVRNGQPSPRHEARAYHLLIDVYRATGNDGRLKVELARYASRYAGTRAADEARRLLRELKAETGNGDQP